MTKTHCNKVGWQACPKCKGFGKKRQKVRKSVRLKYQKVLESFQQSNDGSLSPPPQPKGNFVACPHCKGSGLIKADQFLKPDTKNYPNIAIIGAGIGGVALAVACKHRGIPFTLYEKDTSFDARAQGYGLTLQQASRAIHSFGITDLKDGIVSTRHVVHNPAGEILGEWGMRKWLNKDNEKKHKHTNIHIARQALRLALLDQLGSEIDVQWNHQLINYSETNHQANLTFEVDGKIKTTIADFVVGADGIRSTVRNKIIGETITPLQYLNCMVVLGICKLKDLKEIENPLLDTATVFQTANGHDRIYMMPYDSESIMWQLSFPIPQEEAIRLNKAGAKTLKANALHRLYDWHTPIPQILEASPEKLISGYPVYDRPILKQEYLKNSQLATIIGDAAHPMSPFKGQGANQALLDALSLARTIVKECNPYSNWREKGIRKSVLASFEKEMIERTSPKVKDSSEAARFLHSEIALYRADEPRGRCLKR
ncbi:MAG: FAD-dependent oxidoreductase [Weeksellaceae bacterium]